MVLVHSSRALLVGRLRGRQTLLPTKCIPSCGRHRPSTWLPYSSLSTVSITSLLRLVENGSLTASEAERLLSGQTTVPTADLLGNNSSDSAHPPSNFANLDHTRAARTGFPEAVFAAGKTPDQIASILDSMAAHVNSLVAVQTDDGKEGTNEHVKTQKSRGQGMSGALSAILATRVEPLLYEQISVIPFQHGKIKYHEKAKIISMTASSLVEADQETPSSINEVKPLMYDATKHSRVVVACAGTSDMPVAEEAAVTLEVASIRVDRIYDVGVAGLHRILNALPRLRDPAVGCVIVCAGMDGALPSVVAGLVEVPVVAVPASVGYGACFGGMSAMLTMLNSCSPGVGVVNIDNGFGAAALAFKCINK